MIRSPIRRPAAVAALVLAALLAGCAGRDRADTPATAAPASTPPPAARDLGDGAGGEKLGTRAATSATAAAPVPPR